MNASRETSGRLSPRTRAVLAWGLLALGTLILIVGSLTVWVKRQALDTDAWVDTSSQLLEDDEVRSALSVYIVDQLYSNVDVEARFERRLPPDLEGLAGADRRRDSRSPPSEAVDRFLQRPRVQALWETVNRAAHRIAVAHPRGRHARRRLDRGREGDARPPRVRRRRRQRSSGFGEQLDAAAPGRTRARSTVAQVGRARGSAQTAVKAIKALSWLVILLALAAFAGVDLARPRPARDA